MKKILLLFLFSLNLWPRIYSDIIKITCFYQIIAQSNPNEYPFECEDEFGETAPSSVPCDEVPCVTACEICQESYPCEEECPNILFCNHCEGLHHNPENCNNTNNSGNDIDDDNNNNNNNDNNNGYISGGGYNYYKITQEQLKKAAKETIQKIINDYGTSMAVCNIGVQTLFKKIYGFDPMSNLLANQMINYWQNSPDWESITMDEAISYTKNGHFVVGGWINPSTNGPGHVVVIMPGTDYSPDWNENVPNTMDTGGNHRWTSKRISFSFSAEKKRRYIIFLL